MMFLCCLIPCILDFMLYDILTVGFMIFILSCFWSHCCFHIWPLKRSLSSTSLSRAICTAQSQIILSLAPLSHNSINVIYTKWWSSSYVLSVPFTRCSWTFPFNHSVCLIGKKFSSFLCQMLQWQFHCEWTISGIPTTTPAVQLRAVLWDSFSTGCCFWMSRHALANRPSILLSHPISYCAIAVPVNLSGGVSSSLDITFPAVAEPFPSTTRYA